MYSMMSYKFENPWGKAGEEEECTREAPNRNSILAFVDLSNVQCLQVVRIDIQLYVH